MSTEIPHRPSSEQKNSLDLNISNQELFDKYNDNENGEQKKPFSARILNTRARKFGAGVALFGTVFGAGVAANTVLGGQEETPAPSAEPSATSTEVIESQEVIATPEFQTADLQERYESLVDSLTLSVQDYPTHESAYEKIAADFQNWVTLFPNEEEIAKYEGYVSDRINLEGYDFNNSPGVIQDVDQVAYADTLFVPGVAQEFITQLNEYNVEFINNYDETKYVNTEAVPYDLSYQPVEAPRFTVSASDNNLTSVNISFEMKDNADQNSISQKRIEQGEPPVINEQHNILFKLITTGEGDDAQWKISEAEIYSRG